MCDDNCEDCDMYEYINNEYTCAKDIYEGESIASLHDIQKGGKYNRDDVYAAADLFIQEEGMFPNVVAIAGNTTRTVGVFKLKDDILTCTDVITEWDE